MTAGARPNLSGLFNGSTPAAASPVTHALRTDIDGEDPATASGTTRLRVAPRAAEAGRSSPPPAPPTVAPRASDRGTAGAGWPDPFRLATLYFDALQALLDLNRRIVLGALSPRTR